MCAAVISKLVAGPDARQVGTDYRVCCRSERSIGYMDPSLDFGVAPVRRFHDLHVCEWACIVASGTPSLAPYVVRVACLSFNCCKPLALCVDMAELERHREYCKRDWRGRADGRTKGHAGQVTAGSSPRCHVIS
jgi:hypothetical protein